MIVLGEFKDETKESAKIFNAVLFVVSHSGTFKWRTRSVVRAAYEERFVISTKQRAMVGHLDPIGKNDFLPKSLYPTNFQFPEFLYY